MKRDWLIDIRSQMKLSQIAVSKQSNISQGYYSEIESGLKTPKPESAKVIASVLNFDWTKFYED